MLKSLDDSGTLNEENKKNPLFRPDFRDDHHPVPACGCVCGQPSRGARGTDP